MNTHTPFYKLALPACLLLFAVVGLCVQFAVRLDYGPDEPDHVEYAHVLAWHLRLPTPDETHVVQHPPVYYAAAALLWRASGAAQDPATLTRGPQALGQMTPGAVWGRRLLRFFSTLLACGTLWLLARLLLTLGIPPAWRLWTVLLIAALPMFQYVSSVVNNENLSILYSSLLCLLLVRRVQSGQCSPKQALGLGLLVGAGTLMKQTTLFALPLALWTLWVIGGQEQRAKRLGLFVAGLPVLGIWWPLHNRLVSGQWFPCYTIPQHQQRMASDALSHPLVLLGWLRNMLETSVLPDWSVLFLPRVLPTAAVAVLVLGIGGLVLLGASRSHDLTGRRLRGLALAGLLLLPLGVMQFSLADDYRAQIGGRYLLNGLPWLVTLLGASLPLLPSRWRPSPPLGAVLALILLVLFDVGWWYIVQGYYSSPNFGLSLLENK